MGPQTIETNKESASPAKAENYRQSPTPQRDIQRVNGAQKSKGPKTTGKSRNQKKTSRKNVGQAMKDTVLQNIANSNIERQRQEAKLRRSLEESAEFYDNNRMEEIFIEYFEERENWNQVPEENQNYLAPIMA
ncbi:hypothetical protein B9Z55_006949 [Caenorhabditis nigoni]|uniref:Uncharacterized protein n=1 Tax=Caenorhabditis nigoni TaxID=1611254 RepID=A0A2G5V7Q7_9PELO|nr:hypothetical protein B9Z55_006949 [Caenorhabditis nigoni]